MKEKYLKPPLSYAAQVELLRSRGLFVENPSEAAEFLRQAGYYRFTAYCVPYQKEQDVFLEGSTFRRVRTLYGLDEELRQAVLAVLAPVEIFTRSIITSELSHSWGAFAHCRPELFRSSFIHVGWLAGLEEETRRARETFIDHYRGKYEGFPRLPLWMACEVMSFGSLSRLFGGLLPAPQRKICSVFGIHHEVFRNWLHFITYLRNICAHHGRLWNRGFAIRAEIPRKQDAWLPFGPHNTRIMAGAVVLEWICQAAHLPMRPMERVYDIMKALKEQDPRFAVMMGVPEGIEIDKYWK